MNVSGMIKTGTTFVKDNAPVILTAISAVSTVGAVVMSAQATPLAVRLLNNAECEKGSALTTTEKIKTVAPAYGPVAAMTAIAIGTEIWATMLGEKRQSELLGIACASESLLNKYSSKIVEKFGEDQAKTIKKEAIQEAVPKLIPGDVGVFETGEGQELIVDSWSGRVFRSSEETLRLHYAEFLEQIATDTDTFWPINDFYGLAYIPETGAGRHNGYSSSYKPGDLNFVWDSDRQIYKIMYFDNEPLPELNTRG